MTCTIGRASLSTNPFDLSLDGRTLSFSIDIAAASADELKALRQQLVGMVENEDEPVVPFTWSEDSSLDGFYTDVRVSVPSTVNMLNSYFVQACSVTMTQVTGYASPWWETSLQAVTRTNAYSITTPLTAIITLPGDLVSSEYDLRPYHAGLSMSPVVTPVLRLNGTADTIVRMMNNTPKPLSQYRVMQPVAGFYTGACVFELRYGSTWFPVTGRNFQVGTTRAWRISNGMIRLTSATAAGLGTLEVYDPGSAGYVLSTLVTHDGNQVGGYGGSTAGDGGAPAVLRNSPEVVTVRCAAIDPTGAFGTSFDYTYSIKRGDRLVTITRTDRGAGSLMSIRAMSYPSATLNQIAATFTSGAIVAGETPANDAFGNRVVMGATTALTFPMSNGGIQVSTSTASTTMWIGVELDGSAATLWNTAERLAYQFLGAVLQTQRIVVR